MWMCLCGDVLFVPRCLHSRAAEIVYVFDYIYIQILLVFDVFNNMSKHVFEFHWLVRSVHRREHFNFIPVDFSIDIFLASRIEWSSITPRWRQNRWRCCSIFMRIFEFCCELGVDDFFVKLSHFNKAIWFLFVFPFRSIETVASVNRACLTFDICRVNFEFEVHCLSQNVHWMLRRNRFKTKICSTHSRNVKCERHPQRKIYVFLSLSFSLTRARSHLLLYQFIYTSHN